MSRPFFQLQNQFIVDDVSKIIKEAIENTIGGNAYQHDKGNLFILSLINHHHYFKITL